MLSTDSLRIRRGVSQSPDAATAAAELHAALDQDNASLVIFYASSRYDLAELARQLKKRFGDVPVIGCTTAGEITPTGYLTGSLTGVSIGADDFRVVISRLDGLGGFEFQRGQALASNLVMELESQSGVGPTAKNSFGFLLIDGLSRREEQVVSSIHSGLGGIQLFGGSAGDDGTFSQTFIYHDGEFRNDCALFTLVQTSRRFKIFKTQHFVPTDVKMVVTKADPAARRVVEINGDCARDEYARLVGVSASELTHELLATRPVLVKLGGDYFVRSIMQPHEDGSLSFACAIDEGIVLTLAEPVSMVEDLEKLFDGLRQSVGELQLVLGCDCYFRCVEVKETGLQKEVSRVFCENNVVGFSTYGEQYNSMHINQTFSGVALGDIEP